MRVELQKQETQQEFEQFYRRYFKKIFSYVYRKILDEEVAEDIVQESFYLAYRKWEVLQVHPEPFGWLVLVSRNKILEYLRKMHYREAVELDDVIMEIGVKDFHYDIAEVELVARENLQREEWNLLKSYYWEEKSIDALAESAGVSSNCIRVRITRILHKLRRVMEG